MDKKLENNKNIEFFFYIDSYSQSKLIAHFQNISPSPDPAKKKEREREIELFRRLHFHYRPFQLSILFSSQSIINSTPQRLLKYLH